MRVADDVPSLRSSRRYASLSRCFTASRGRFGLRLIEFSILGNHLHLIVEADDSRSLSRGMQGLAIRVAKALNASIVRGGAVFADHYHSRLLRSPTELVRAIRYVLGNALRHYGEEGEAYSSRGAGAVELLDDGDLARRSGTEAHFNELAK